MFTQSLLQVWNKSEIVSYLAGDNKIYTIHSTMNGVQLFYCHQPDSKWSRIDLKFAIRTEWTSNCITMLWGRAGFSLHRYQGSSNLEFRVFIVVIYFIVTSQIAKNLRLISNLLYRLSGHPPSSNQSFSINQIKSIIFFFLLQLISNLQIWD